MGKKIVILNGSPRRNGNTSGLVKAFSQGAEEAGNTVKTFFLDGMNIHGCKGCFSGGKNIDSPCVQKDDMDKIYPAYREADVIVLASPLYYWQLSGQLRMTFDRFFAIDECAVNWKSPIKESVLLVAAGGNDFEDVEQYYKSLVKHIKWKNLGTVFAGGVLKIGDIEKKSELEEARKIGLSINGGS
ncbi:multimeric flavodoxin WrbA family protein [Treponema primitia ZAS-2]|uniref:Multimeric flavodoxin WrbA family protein n=1 Tax=Treponema primitia (strain ATCC BAA-887 / DSM 12427 / ZAS-2) TaxID=545694 RepID=F5YK82_TREPZ|nr:NAD(P)H-dependent oxidoreductase [Treponema primitia]AEF84712.1 multimeric flavodoxin WrbA family protein [Treponema primitia ZAS-2]